MGKLKNRIQSILLAARGKPWPGDVLPAPPWCAQRLDVHTFGTIVHYESVDPLWLNTTGEYIAGAEAARKLAELLLEHGAIEVKETERRPGISPGTTSVWYAAKLRAVMPTKEG